MGYKEAFIGAVLGLMIGVILMAFLLSEIGSQLDPMTYAIFAYCVPILFCIYGAYKGYEYDI